MKNETPTIYHAECAVDGCNEKITSKFPLDDPRGYACEDCHAKGQEVAEAMAEARREQGWAE